MAVRKHGLFRHVERPAADVAKGGCYITGSAASGVDTGVNIDFEGTLFLSDSTIKELAEVAGYSVNEEGMQLEIDNAWLVNENERLQAEVADLETQLTLIGVAISRGRAATT